MTEWDPQDLLEPLESLRASLLSARLELEIAGAAAARAARAGLLGQIDDYLAPRLRDLGAPMLVVVGGSTGAGKSTLVNSLVGREVSPAGVLRPTTRAPVLVCHPSEVGWWETERTLPGLVRTTGRASGDERALHLMTEDSMPTGMALIDAPDIDSVVASNRDLAAQLLAAADLWLFLTTAARYADAVPWSFLRQARDRSTAIALILNRVPAEAEEDVPQHLASLLQEERLQNTPVFTIRETPLIEGRIPEDELGPVQAWVSDLAGDAIKRNEVVRKTLEGALESIDERVALLVAHVGAEASAARDLQSDVNEAYGGARVKIVEALGADSLLRSEVMARWHEVVGTGDFMRSLESHIGIVRDRIRRALTGQGPPSGAEISRSLLGSVETVVVEAADGAAERVTREWEASPAGRALLSAVEGGVGRSSVDFDDRVRDAVAAWQGRVLELVRAEGAAKRVTGRILSLGVNAVGAAAMVTVFAHTGGLTGAEIAVAGGTATLSQKLLEALFGDQAVRELTARARADLLERVEGLLDTEAERLRAPAAAAGPDPGEVYALRDAVEALQRNRWGDGRP
jgi:hypothetical protein